MPLEGSIQPIYHNSHKITNAEQHKKDKQRIFESIYKVLKQIIAKIGVDKPYTRRATAKGIQAAIKPSRTLDTDKKQNKCCHIKRIKDRLVRIAHKNNTYHQKW